MSAESPDHSRHLPIEGTHNFRDVGGYPTASGGVTRWRTLFRSDSLHALTDAGRRAVEDLGLVTAIDLRYERELKALPSALAGHPRIAYRNKPMGPGTAPFAEPAETLEEFNVYLLEHCQAFGASILRDLADARAYPALLSCAGGKDRTGLIVALLLSLAGVPREHVVADYVLSRIDAAQVANIHELLTAEGHDAKKVGAFLECRPETMEHTLDHLDRRYGGAEGYVREIGLSEAAVGAIRTALVEPAP